MMRDMKERAWQLPHFDIRHNVQCSSDIDMDGLNVFRRGVKACALMVLPNLRLNTDGELKLDLIMTENQAACFFPSSSLFSPFRQHLNESAPHSSQYYQGNIKA